MTAINIDRFHPYQCNPEYRRQRALESLGLVYACHYPDRSPKTARGARKSPFHERLALAGAAHGVDGRGVSAAGQVYDSNDGSRLTHQSPARRRNCFFPADRGSMKVFLLESLRRGYA